MVLILRISIVLTCTVSLIGAHITGLTAEKRLLRGGVTVLSLDVWVNTDCAAGTTVVVQVFSKGALDRQGSFTTDANGSVHVGDFALNDGDNATLLVSAQLPQPCDNSSPNIFETAGSAIQSVAFDVPVLNLWGLPAFSFLLIAAATMLLWRSHL